MADLILHHYAGSPFSEKVRLVLGMKGLRWRSVDVPVILPKPDVVALTGGYRRTPFLQIDADIYCDSALMCRVIDRLHPEPPLYPDGVAGLAEIVAQWADSSLFWIAVPYTMQPANAAHLIGDAAPAYLKAFAADRAAMNPNLRRATLADARAALDAYFGRLASILADGRPFLLGALPTIADVSAAQSVWFMNRVPATAEWVRTHAAIDAWYGRVAAFGHGERGDLSSEQALRVAAAATDHAPTHVEPGQGLAAGDEVGVVPTDYAHDEVVGQLVGLDADEIVVARRDPRAGPVQVHFPRIGFQVKARALPKDSA